jgi:sensor c-di-GMP phosphodiesterase-like protein
VPSSALVLELTETAVMSHPQRCQEVMRELRALHVGLSLDDYGTGYASLAYLTTLPVDELKIDKSFVLGMRDNHVDRVVVPSTLELAGQLGLRVVAEGVEDEECAALLREYGCRIGQGWLYGRPVPPHEVVLDLTGRAGPSSSRPGGRGGGRWAHQAAMWAGETRRETASVPEAALRVVVTEVGPRCTWSRSRPRDPVP